MTDPAALEERVAALEATVGRLVQAEADFMSVVRVDTFRVGMRVESVRLTHLPTGVMVEAPTRPEAAAKLERALERRAERHANWAGGVPGPGHAVVEHEAAPAVTFTVSPLPASR